MTTDNVVVPFGVPGCTRSSGNCSCLDEVQHHRDDAVALAHVRTLLAWEAWASQSRPDALERIRAADDLLRELAEWAVDEWNVGAPDHLKLPEPERVVVVGNEPDGGPRAA